MPLYRVPGVSSEAHYGRLLAPYLDDPGHVFIVSSDFCHWGTRFNYVFYDRSRARPRCIPPEAWHTTARQSMHLCACVQGAIHQSIEWLDKLGMDAIEQVRHQCCAVAACGTARCTPTTDVSVHRGAPRHLQAICGSMATPSVAATPSAYFLNVCPASLVTKLLVDLLG